MGCDLTPYVKSACREFQSTHPVWDATLFDAKSATHEGISIHASRMGCDWFACGFFRLFFYFNPRIPYGMRRDLVTVTQSANPISIHASRMGCDYASTAPDNIFPDDFNPRIPYGMRQYTVDPRQWVGVFQSTHPVWDATRRHNQVDASQTNFNPRIPYGMRLEIPEIWEDLKKFQSTHPVWDATLTISL